MKTHWKSMHRRRARLFAFTARRRPAGCHHYTTHNLSSCYKKPSIFHPKAHHTQSSSQKAPLSFLPKSSILPPKKLALMGPPAFAVERRHATAVHYYTDHKMDFKVMVTTRASWVEKWIREVKSRYLDAAPTKCVGLDCEFTDYREVGRDNQRAAVLQLSVASENLVFQILYANQVPQLLIDFLGDKSIMFCGVAIGNDQQMLEPYGIHIGFPVDLQKIKPNPTTNPNNPSLYDLSNAIVGTKLEKKKKPKRHELAKMSRKEIEEYEELIFAWANYPLSGRQIQYAALDSRLGFEIARRHWRLHGYNSHFDEAGLNIY